MYGAIYGDLVGSIYEYSQIKRIISINPDKLLTDKSFYSDDTILTIAILDAIKNNQDYNYYLKKYINEYKNYKPNFKPYFKTTFSPGLIKWSESNKIGISKGNGALMRISPVGFMFDNEHDVVKNAIDATIPSHSDPEAINAAIEYSLMIYLFRNGYSKEEVKRKLELDYNYVPFTKFNTLCDETLNNCLYAFYNSNSFEEVYRNTLLMGGDTDTNCAINGGLAESLYGITDNIKYEVETRIPVEFIKVLRK